MTDHRVFKNVWQVYWPDEEFQETSPKLAIASTLSIFFEENQNELVNYKTALERGCVAMDYQLLRTEIPVGDFDRVLRSEPHTVLACLDISMHKCLITLYPDFPLDRIHVRLFNYEPETPMKTIKSNLVEKFVSISGNVVRVGSVRPIVISVIFVCKKCDARFRSYFPDGRFQMFVPY